MPDPLAARIKKRKPFESVAQEAFLNLWRLVGLLEPMHEDLFAAHGLTAHQFNILRILRGEHPARLRPAEIVSRMVTRAPDITRLLERLERGGLVQRQRRSHGRFVNVGITPRGLALLRELDQPLLDCHSRQLGHLGQEKLEELIELVEEARAPHENRITGGSEWLRRKESRRG